MAKKLSLKGIILNEYGLDPAEDYQDFLRKQEEDIDEHDNVEIYIIYDGSTKEEVHHAFDEDEALEWMESHNGLENYYIKQTWIPYREYLEDYGGEPIY